MKRILISATHKSSGKTTIAGLAASFFNPEHGIVKIDGHDLSKCTLDSYRSRLGVVLQDDFLFDGTILDNIRFGYSAANEQAVEEAVRAAHVKEFADRFDDGLEAISGEMVLLECLQIADPGAVWQ